jgi:hydrogenase assembly chaperone HypC/HupF
MCLSAPVRIEHVDGPLATARIGGQTLRLSTAAVPDIRPGEWALVAGGVIVRRIDRERAAEIAAALDTVKGDPR